MMFLGTSFLGGRYIIDPSPTSAKNIKNIYIENGVFDQLFISKNSNLEVENGYDDWNFDTILNATFDSGNLDAGNSGFSLQNTEYVLIKCREKGTLDWTPIFVKSINSIEDFNININDYYRPNNINLEYMIVSVCNGIENTYVSEEIKSEFDGMYICDKDNIYGTIYNLDFIDSTRANNSSILNMYNSEYASVVSNGKENYDSGTVSGAFLKFDQSTNIVDIHGGNEYRDKFKTWLNNRKPKILKFYDGRIWLISVSGDISDNSENHSDLRKISFDWVEIGKLDSKTMYNCGLINVGKEWWY